jgi:transcriptional regulator with XRE-family HTH domain
MPRPRGYDKPFGHHALRNLREWQGIAPGELADRVVAGGGHLSAQTVRNIESATTRPSLALLDRLLAALHSDPDRLEQVRGQLIEADEEQKAQATQHLTTRGLAGGDEAPASSSLPPDLDARPAPDSSAWSSTINAPAAALYAAAAPPPQTGAPSVRRRARARSASMPKNTREANTRTVPAAEPAPARREASPDRPSLPAPEAPEPWEALRELGDIYSQLNDAGRHALIGRARQLLATQRAADVDASAD